MGVEKQPGVTLSPESVLDRWFSLAEMRAARRGPGAHLQQWQVQDAMSHLPPHGFQFPPGTPPLQETGCAVCLENPEPLLISARLGLPLLWGLSKPTRSFSELSSSASALAVGRLAS